MPPSRPRPDSKTLPGWWDLWRLAHVQAGLFTARDAEACHVSAALLTQNVASGVLTRAERGIYRFATFPPHAQESMVARWLWTGREGVYSHESALFLHHLSDVLPDFLVLTVPRAWASRRRQTPPGVELHLDDLSDGEVLWVDAIPVTKPLRTVLDCERVGVSPELVEAAAREAITRGMFTRQRYLAERRKGTATSGQPRRDTAARTRSRQRA